MLFQRTHIKDSGNYFKGDNLITVLVNKKAGVDFPEVFNSCSSSRFAQLETSESRT